MGILTVQFGFTDKKMSSLSVNELRVSNIESYNLAKDSITIDSSGRSLVPNQPAFYGYRSAGAVWENYGTTPATYNYNIAVTNRGNCYNTSNGLFTCPISGVYAVCPGMLAGSSGNYATLQVYVNGLNKTARGVHANTNTLSNWHTSCTTFMVRCNKNDILEVRATTGAATIYAGEYSHCSIWLYN